MKRRNGTFYFENKKVIRNVVKFQHNYYHKSLLKGKTTGIN